jgi:hypothetical protein
VRAYLKSQGWNKTSSSPEKMRSPSRSPSPVKRPTYVFEDVLGSPKRKTLSHPSKKHKSPSSSPLKKRKSPFYSPTKKRQSSSPVVKKRKSESPTKTASYPPGCEGRKGRIASRKSLGEGWWLYRIKRVSDPTKTDPLWCHGNKSYDRLSKIPAKERKFLEGK